MVRIHLFSLIMATTTTLAMSGRPPLSYGILGHAAAAATTTTKPPSSTTTISAASSDGGKQHPTSADCKEKYFEQVVSAYE